jgi:pimeloyl-ACP methyl ester carboxylesterase
VLVDLLQYGRSAKPAIKGPMWDFHARALRSLLDALEIPRADLVCNSWGGTQALCLAAMHPERVGSLVVTGSMPVFYGPLAPLPERAARGRNARLRYYGDGGPTREKMRELMASLEWYDADAIPELTIDLRYRQSLEPDEISCGQVPENRGEWQDLSDELRRVEAPTLFLWGMYDAFLTPDYPLMLANMVPRGSLFVMDHASHHLQEERPEEYAAIALAFLDAAHDRSEAR